MEEKQTLSTKIKKVGIEILNRVLNKFEPTAQEALIRDIVLNTIRDEGTKKIIWESNMFLIKNDSSYIKLDHGNLYILTDKNNIMIQCSIEFTDWLKGQVAEVVAESIDEIEKTVEQHKMQVIEDINKMYA